MDTFASVDEIAKPIDLGSNWLIRAWRITVLILRTLPRDLRTIYIAIKVLLKTKSLIANTTVPSHFSQIVAKHPNKVCFHCEDRSITFLEMEKLSNKIATIFHNHGFRKGDVVALFMESRPEFVAVWLGLSKLGICTALINFNLRDKPLLHCITIAEAKALVVGSELISAVENLGDQLDSSVKVFNYGSKGAEFKTSMPIDNLDVLIEVTSPTSPPKADFKNTDRLLYIYTSGTTGLPKAAIITHLRYLLGGIATTVFMGMNESDIIYACLPLYHTSGGIMGVGMAVLNGNTVAISKKFSASRFWKDCIKYKCTMTQYIGETCRYLLAQPTSPDETNHKIRLMYGNGLRPQIWKAFVDRFRIRNIREFYGSTEGNLFMINMDNKVGAVGALPWYSVLSRVLPSLMLVDEKTGQPIRSKDGLCIRCLPGEAGEMMSGIKENDPFRQFTGYVDKQATNKKVMSDVFTKGDKAFLTGDILVMDELGYLYFKDRTGDTFRWKGENVSTAEVEAVISNLVDFRDCCAYGVEVPGCEGRAGMAAILDPRRELNIEKLGSDIATSLPIYARPLFIKLKSEISLTGTYKLQKVEFLKDGFDPNVDSDPIYFLDSKTNGYLRLDKATYDRIRTQQIRL